MRMRGTVGIQTDVAHGQVGSRRTIRRSRRAVIREIANQGIHGVRRRSIWFEHQQRDWENGIRMVNQS